MLPREHFSESLKRLQEDLTGLGKLVACATRDSVIALLNRDTDLAKQVVTNDQEINRRRFEWEEQALVTIATQNPVASDLRMLIAGLHIVDELERMGDHAKGIAEISLRIGDNPLIYPQNSFQKMAELGSNMLEAALVSFTGHNASLAEATAIKDDEVDALYNVTSSDLLELMLSDRANITQGNLLTWAAHHLERIGDRSTNICERVIFVCTGRMVEIPGAFSRVPENQV